MPRPSLPDRKPAARATDKPARHTAALRLAAPLIAWQRQAGRHDLPWQVADPYRVWLSEIMLQQTQVVTVIPYFEAFLKRFPDIGALAAASQEDVLEAWSGLGYYSRARNLHRCAQVLVAEHGGSFPQDAAALAALPGIGPSTAAAIAVFSFGQKEAILDGNVKRVLSRVFGIAGTGTASERELWQIAREQLPDQQLEAYTQGLMDLGASLCSTRRWQCPSCPLKNICLAGTLGLQASLPSARLRKAIPLREAHFALLLKGEEVLLQMQPAPGIWGGLLSLPTIAQVQAMLTEAGLQASEGEAAGGFEHSFTHFKLKAAISRWIMPEDMSLRPAISARGGALIGGSACDGASRNAASRVAEPAAADLARWVPRHKLAGAALPKPVKTWLLQQFKGN